MLRILTDRGTEYCGRVDHHDYQLYLAIYKKIWTIGLNPITMTELIREKCAVGVRRWKLYLMVNRFGLKRI